MIIGVVRNPIVVGILPMARLPELTSAALILMSVLVSATAAAAPSSGADCGPPVSQRVRSLVTRGQDEYAKGNYPQSIELWQQA